MFVTFANPPDDLDRIAAAWAKLQDLVNRGLPDSTARLAAARARAASAPPSGRRYF